MVKLTELTLEILSKIGIGFISNFLLKARVLFYCSLNTKFFIFKKEIMLKNGTRMVQEWRFAHTISMHYRDFEHAYVY